MATVRRRLYEEILGDHPPLLLLCSTASTLSPGVAHIPGSVVVSLPKITLKWLSAALKPYMDREVVCYQAEGLDLAAIVWWQLRVVGVSHCHVLDGGLALWHASGNPVNYSVLTELTVADGCEADESFIDMGKYHLAEDIERLVKDESRPVQLIDTEGNYPGAIQCPASLFLTSDRTLLDPETAEVLLDGLKIKRSAFVHTVVMGRAAQIVLLVLWTLGVGNLSLGLPQEQGRDRFYSASSGTVFLDVKETPLTAHAAAQPVRASLPAENQCSCCTLI